MQIKFNTGIRLILIVTYSQGNALDPNPQQSQMGPSLLHLYTYCKLSQNLLVLLLFFYLTENYRELTTLQCVFLCVATS